MVLLFSLQFPFLTENLCKWTEKFRYEGYGEMKEKRADILLYLQLVYIYPSA